MARINFLRQDGEWSQSPSRSFLKNRTSEIFVKIYRLVVYVENYIGKRVYTFFIFGGVGGGGGRGYVYIWNDSKKNTMIIFLRLLLFLHWKLVSILFYSRERKLLLKRGKKNAKSPHPSTFEKMTIYLSGELQLWGKSRHLLMCAC